MKKLLVFFCASAMCALAGTAAEYYVGPGGSDSAGDGSAAKPFATFGRAAEAVMSAPEGNYKITVAPGDYEFQKSVRFTKSKMKGKTLSIVGIADGKKRARLLGGRTVSGDNLAEVTDSAVLAKIPKDAEGKLYFLDLKKFGMTDYGKLGRRGWGYGNPAFEMEAHKNYAALTCAKYPNTVKPAPIGEVLDHGTITHDVVGLKKIERDPNPRGGTFVFDSPRVARWAGAPDPWIMGNMSTGWAYEHTPIKSIDADKKSITLGAPSVYGVWSNTPKKSERGYPARADLGVRGFHIFNLLEEADADGEYYIDRKNGIFYVILKEPPTKDDAFTFSLVSAPLLEFRDVSGVSISNVDISISRGVGLTVSNCSNFKISGCVFSGCKLGADIFGNNIKFDRCIVRYNTAGGMVFRGGDEKTLSRANSEITNTEFYENATRRERGSHALTIRGVGLRLANCHFHDHPDHTVVYGGSYITIERNIFERCCRNASDMGVIYGGGISGAHGRIVRYNFFTENLANEGDDKSAICGVYLDEGGFDVNVHDNIFCRTGTQAKSPAFGAIYIHGGANARATNNVFIDCDSAFGCQPWTDKRYAEKLENRKNNHKFLWEMMNSEVYKKAYPPIEKMLDPSQPRLNYAENNRVFGTSMAMNGDLYLRGNRNIFPKEGVSRGMLFEKKNWTLADVEKYFGDDPLVKKILSVPMGILK